MAAPMELCESFQTLLQLYNEVDQQKNLLEKQCRKCRQLFKPWPTKATRDDRKKTEEQEGKKNNELSQKEAVELNKMERIISKANRLMKSHSKAQEEALEKNFATPSYNTETETVSQVKENNKCADITVSLFKDTVDHRSKGNTIENNLKCLQAQPKKIEKNDTIRKKDVGTSKKTEMKRSILTVQTKKGISSNGNMSRRDRTHVPVHMTAPFRTNPDSFLKKSTTTGSAFQNKKLSAVKRKTQQGKTEITGSIYPESNLDKNCFKVDEFTAKVSGDKSRNDSHNEVMEDFNKELKDVTSGCDRQINEDCGGEKPFCLLTDGSNLKIPSKLRKLFHNNHRLRQNLYVEMVTTKVDRLPSDRGFLQQMEEQFYVQRSDCLSHMKAARQYHHGYVNLKRLLEDLHLDNFTEKATAADLLRAKKILEFILTAYEKLAAEQAEIDKQCVERCKHEYQLRETVNLLTIIPQTKKMMDMSETVLQSHVQVSGRNLQYKSMKQLRRYTSLLFNIRYHQIQIFIMETIAKEIIPILESLDPNSSEFVAVFRGAYSLLSGDGQQCPVVVRDTIEELEDTE